MGFFLLFSHKYHPILWEVRTVKNQTLFSNSELARVIDKAERNHLIECAQDQSKIDLWYMEIMEKYDLFL